MKKETKDPKLEGMLTELDPPYESKEELDIGRMLDQYGIPFFYKQSTVIYDQGQNEIQKPSFTLYPYGSWDNQKDELLRREQLYRYNQIPAVLLGPRDLAEPNWQELLYGKLEQMYSRTSDMASYASERNQS